ncbi:Protein IQ-DOMAIN 31 [Linum perenne]
MENSPPLTISQPVLVVGAGSVVNSEHAATTELRNEKTDILCGKEEGGSHQVSEIVSLDEAVTKVQENVTGSLALHEVDKDRGIVRLQAVIRGHLVRRQAVATLNCAWAIVKFQALVRGLKVRCSSTGVEVQNTINLAKLLALSAASANPRSTLGDKNFENAFVRKLLSSTVSAMPLALQYSPEEPNSAMEWLNRWTRSRFWEHVSEQKIDHLESESPLKKQESLEKVEAQKCKQKQPVRKSSSPNVANGKTLESNKPKRNPRKPVKADVGNKHPETVPVKVKHPETAPVKVKHLETAPVKVKHTLKKASVAMEKDEADGVTPKRNVKKTEVPVPEQDNHASADTVKDVHVAVSSQADGAPSPEVKHENSEHLQNSEVNGVLTNVQENTNILQLDPIDALGGNENSKTNQRRASLPANVDQQENGVLGTPKLPSYMTPTQSAKAKLRGTGSPAIPQEGIEKNSTTTRRHSLPSSINEKCVSMSPRAYRQVHSANKGFLRSDRSLTSSRDGSVSDRMIRPEWRR